MTDKTFEKYKLVIDEWLVNGFNGTKAYQKFYPKSDKVTADGNFRKIHEITRVAEYVKQKQSKTSNKLQITLEKQLLELDRFKDISEQLKRPSDAINAIKEQNKLLGLYEVDNKQKTDTKPARITFTKRDGNK
jgi:phage terminase small subunit